MSPAWRWAETCRWRAPRTGRRPWAARCALTRQRTARPATSAPTLAAEAPAWAQAGEAALAGALAARAEAAAVDRTRIARDRREVKGGKFMPTPSTPTWNSSKQIDARKTLCDEWHQVYDERPQAPRDTGHFPV